MSYCNKYEIEISEVNYRIDLLSDGMVNVNNSIRFFSCTYQNIFRQTQVYLKLFISIFLFECYELLLSTSFRLQLILELIGTLITGKS